jgi:hypothetical protein
LECLAEQVFDLTVVGVDAGERVRRLLRREAERDERFAHVDEWTCGVDRVASAAEAIAEVDDDPLGELLPDARRRGEGPPSGRRR